MDRQVQPPSSHRRRKYTERGLKKDARRVLQRHRKEPPEASKRLPKGPRDPDHGPRRLRGVPSSLAVALGAPGPAPRRAQEGPRRPRNGPKTATRGPKTGSRRRSEASKERVRTKKRKYAPRLGGSPIFEGRTASKDAPNRPDLGSKSAQTASRAEDATGTAEQSARRPEIRPRTADGRLEEGSELTATRLGLEVFSMYPASQGLDLLY